MTRVYSDRQLDIMKKWQRGELKRINLLQGSVRSGKTWISIVLWVFWVASMPKDARFIMCGKTLSSLKRNVLDVICEMVGTYNFNYSVSKKEAVLFGRQVYLEGVSDNRSESKIRGMTLAGAYCDEVSLFNEEFFAMLLSRLSVKGAKLIATTNPDNPSHWLKKKYIDRCGELDMLVENFTIEDNIFLDSEYVESLKKEYTGVFYDRFILGKWVAAEGLVYPMFDENYHVTDAKSGTQKCGGDELYYISIDYGTANPCSMGLWQIADGKAVRIGEYYYDSRKVMSQKTDEEYYAELVRLADGRVIQAVVVDPSAASFIETIRRHGQFSVRKADNDVLGGIRVVASLLNGGKIFFDRSCTDAIREFGLYSWDTNADKDKVIKEFDHAMDDIRYFCKSVLWRMVKWEL